MVYLRSPSSDLQSSLSDTGPSAILPLVPQHERDSQSLSTNPIEPPCHLISLHALAPLHQVCQADAPFLALSYGLEILPGADCLWVFLWADQALCAFYFAQGTW